MAKQFYIFDGEEYVEVSDTLLEDLLNLCEDNEVMKETIEEYFKGENEKY